MRLIYKKHISLISCSLSFYLTAISCKSSTSQDASTKDLTYFDQVDTLDLTTFDQADETHFQAMRKELPDIKFDQYESEIKDIPRPGSIRLEEATILYLYSGSVASILNKALRSVPATDLPSLKNTVIVAASGLNRLPSFKNCVANRGVYELPPSIVECLIKRKRFIDKGFVSASYQWRGFGGNIKFTIHSDHCKKIDWVSKYPHETEVLFPPGSEFIVNDSQLHVVDGVVQGTVDMTHTMERLPGLKPPTDCQNLEPKELNLKSLPQSFTERGFSGVTFFREGNSSNKITFNAFNNAIVQDGSTTLSATWELSQKTITLTTSKDPQKTEKFKVQAIDKIAILDPIDEEKIIGYYLRN